MNQVTSSSELHLSLWPSGIGSRLGRNRLWVRFLAVSDIYHMFIEPTITWVPSGLSGYIWLDTKKLCLKNQVCSILDFDFQTRKVVMPEYYLFSSSDLNSKDPRWIGAWWLPYIISAALCLLVAFPMFGYASDFPESMKTREHQITTSAFNEFKELIRDVLTNPTFVCISVYTTCDIFVVSGFTSFGTKFLQYNLTISSSKSVILYGE